MDQRTWLMYQQNLEYEESLRNDIEKDLKREAYELDNQEMKRIEIEEMMILEAEHLDEQKEACNLSPKSLRLKRLAFFENKIETNKPNVRITHCKEVTLSGKKCRMKALEGYTLCHIHKRKLKIMN